MSEAKSISGFYDNPGPAHEHVFSQLDNPNICHVFVGAPLNWHYVVRSDQQREDM